MSNQDLIMMSVTVLGAAVMTLILITIQNYLI